MMKILKTKPSDNYKIVRISRRSTLSDQDMSSDDTKADLQMSSQKNHQSYRVNQKKV